MDHDNPAQRLLDILEEGKAYNAAAPFQQAWTQLLKTTDSVVLLRRLGKLLEIPGQVSEILSIVAPKLTDPTKHWAKCLRASIFFDGNQVSWTHRFGVHIDDRMMESVGTIATLLDAHAHCEPLGQDDLEKYRSQLEDAIEKLRVAKVLPQIKLDLMRVLKNAVQAIDEYFITGTWGIAEANNEIAGLIATNSAVQQEVASSHKDGGFGKTIYNAVMLMASAIQVATGLPQLPGSVDQLIKLLSI